MDMYFDNAATSWPKPKSVLKAMRHYFSCCGGNPGRSGHEKAIEAGRIVLDTREKIGKLFNIEDPSRIIFTKNATEALNIALFGILRKGGHLVTTSMEHNSVLRPVRRLETMGLAVTIVEGDETGTVDPQKVVAAIEKRTTMVCVNHASNVTGTIQDIAPVAAVCRERSVPFLVDAAQTAGALPIDCGELGVDFLAASGHKGLLGPQGTGILYVRKGVEETGLEPFMVGGTGSLSDREDQPDFFPDFLESGTLNVIGIAGLGAGAEYLLERGVDAVREKEQSCIRYFLEELRRIDGVEIYGPKNPQYRTGVVSITLRGLTTSKVGEILNEKYGIYTRIGLHCAPRAHKTIKTFPNGTVRFGFGPFTKDREIRKAVKAVQEIAAMEKTRA